MNCAMFSKKLVVAVAIIIIIIIIIIVIISNNSSISSVIVVVVVVVVAVFKGPSPQETSRRQRQFSALELFHPQTFVRLRCWYCDNTSLQTYARRCVSAGV